mmetsp:Transcript_82690/g.242619  ORF Transcript_82690/g.242619 Transcript_82690/m.242619 type:complete len:949 (+) Transcript_82690:62-2908(+)
MVNSPSRWSQQSQTPVRQLVRSRLYTWTCKVPQPPPADGMGPTDGLAAVRRQLLEDIGQLLEQRLGEEVLARLAEEARRRHRNGKSAPQMPAKNLMPDSTPEGEMLPAASDEGRGPSTSSSRLGRMSVQRPPRASGVGEAPLVPPPEPYVRWGSSSRRIVRLGEPDEERPPQGTGQCCSAACVNDMEQRVDGNDMCMPYHQTTGSDSRRSRSQDDICSATCGAVVGHRASASSASSDGLTRFRGAARAVLFSHRLHEVIRYRETPRNSVASNQGSQVAEDTGAASRSSEALCDRVSDATTLSNVSKLTISPVWAEDIDPGPGRRRKKKESLSPMGSMTKGSMTFGGAALNRSGSCSRLLREHHDESHRRKNCLERCMLRPTNHCCVLWDIWTTLAIGYDIVQLPLAEAFDLKAMALTVLELVTAITWLMDMLLSFMRGYVDSQLGIVEMRPRRIAFHYLKTWFCLDAVVVALDFFLQWMEHTEWLKFLTILRFFRLLRLLRVVRIIKVSSRLSTMAESMQVLGITGGSEKVAAVLQIMKQLLMLVVINHFIACGWYALGREVTDGWVLSHVAISRERNSAYLYFTAFHWSITQFTPASMEVTPTTTAERIFTICAIFLGLVMFSSFVSSMTQSMTHLRQLTMKETQSSLHVRRYISDNHISSELASRVMGVIRLNKANRRTRLKMSEVGVFSSLPQSLQAQLHEEVFAPVVCRHVVFGNLRAVDGPRFSRICLESINERHVARSEEVFLNGSPGKNMYFIQGGKLSYSYDDNEEELPDTSLAAGQRVAEVVLWAKWDHRGRLSAAMQSEILEVTAEAFQMNVLASNVAVQMQLYARLFVAKSSLSCGSAHSVTDLWGSDAEVEDIAQRAFRGSVSRKASGRRSEASIVDVLAPDDPGVIMMQQAFLEWKEFTAASRGSCMSCCWWKRRSAPHRSWREEDGGPRSGGVL